MSKKTNPPKKVKVTGEKVTNLVEAMQLEKRTNVQDGFDNWIIELDNHTQGNAQFLSRNENGKEDGVDSYWIYYKERRFARFDVYFDLTNEEAYHKTKEYLDFVTAKHYSMTPFIGYFTADGEFKIYLYRKGPNITEVGFNGLIDLMQKFYEQDKKNETDGNQEYVNNLHEIIDTSELSESKKEQVKRTISLDTLEFSEEHDSIRMKPSSENQFYTALLQKEGDDKIQTICRYTSVNSLFRILNDRKTSMLSIVCMNDASEGHYAQNYLIDRGCRFEQNTWKENNRFFIQSCSEEKELDDLFMWTMYGDDAKGVCVQYEIDRDLLRKTPSLYMARISYAQENKSHPELDVIASILTKSTLELPNLPTWLHFFKSFEYHKENEIRLLYENNIDDTTKWVITGDGIMSPLKEFSINEDKEDTFDVFPFIMKTIIVGPKTPNREAVISQIEAMINLHKSQNQDCFVRPSKIKSYR